jgi:osmotically-inducible protein OsmY
MKNQHWLLTGSALGAGLGAGLMYLLDPQGGGRRRALARDKAMHVLRKGGEAARKRSRDLGNRTKGFVAEARSSLRQSEVDDEILRDRVRSKIGRVVSHPAAIEVAAANGCVVLSGPVLASEVDRLLSTVRSVKGVCGVENRLEVHEQAENVSALQGEGRSVQRLGKRSKIGVALGVASLGLLANGLAHRRGDAPLL